MNIKAISAVALAGGIALSLSACGSSAAAKTSTNGNSNQNGYGTRAGIGGGFPGASGLVAAVNGATAQVQSSSAQTAVSWTSTTSFTDEVKVTKAAIKVGECVQAARAQSTTGSSSSTSTTTLAAATVRIENTSGGCITLRQGTGGGAPNGGTAPSGAPTNFPGGQNGTRPRNFGNFATIGVVTSVSSSGFVVKPTAFGTSSTSPVTVTTSSSTTYTQSKKATSAAVKVGVCMSANGTTDSTGAVAAKRITLSQPTNGVCTTQTRFGGGFPGGGSPGGGFGGGAGAPQNG
jgi:hypothetical protein